MRVVFWVLGGLVIGCKRYRAGTLVGKNILNGLFFYDLFAFIFLKLIKKITDLMN